MLALSGYRLNRYCTFLLTVSSRFSKMCMKEVMNNDRIIKTNLSLCTFLLTVSSRFSKMCMKEVMNNDRIIKTNLSLC